MNSDGAPQEESKNTVATSPRTPRSTPSPVSSGRNKNSPKANDSKTASPKSPRADLVERVDFSSSDEKSASKISFGIFQKQKRSPGRTPPPERKGRIISPKLDMSKPDNSSKSPTLKRWVYLSHGVYL